MHYFMIAHKSMRVVLFWAEIYSKCEDIQAVMGDEGMDSYRAKDDLENEDDYDDGNDDEEDGEVNVDEDEDGDSESDSDSGSDTDNMILSEIVERNTRVRMGQTTLVPRSCG
jgi:hypothetical protein